MDNRKKEEEATVELIEQDIDDQKFDVIRVSRAYNGREYSLREVIAPVGIINRETFDYKNCGEAVITMEKLEELILREKTKELIDLENRRQEAAKQLLKELDRKSPGEVVQMGKKIKVITEKYYKEKMDKSKSLLRYSYCLNLWLGYRAFKRNAREHFKTMKMIDESSKNQSP